MNYCIAVFRSRASTLNFANKLKESGIPVAIINTPHGIYRACGISVKFLRDYLKKVQQIASRMQIFSNFDGFYTYTFQFGRQVLTKI